MLQIIMLLILPVGTAVAMLAIREHFSLWHYVSFCFLIVGIGFISWILVDNISWAKGLSGGGFRSWALPLAAATIAVLCSWRSRRKCIQFLQMLAAVIFANIWFAYAGWVA
ncbi:MAG: hypothetical protein PVI97_07200 [Candidatus Thiodiazotropha sp.]